MKTAKFHYLFFFLWIVSFLLFMTLATLRENYILVNTFDTGLYMQLLRNISSYGDWSSSVTGENNFLAHHFQPIIYFIVPLFELFPKAILLYGLSGVSAGVCAWMLFKRYRDNLTSLLMGCMILSVIWHPSIVGRMLLFFCPDVLALPFLLYQAFCLTEKDGIGSKHIFKIIICQLLAGFCKENIWLINAWVSLLMAFSHRDRRRVFSLLFVINVTIFGCLFFYYMPRHTVMPSYYGLQYFINPRIEMDGLRGLFSSMFLNIFSLQSASTFFFGFVVLSGVFPFVNYSKVLLASLPAILFIIAASHNQLHLPQNQYFLFCLPFFWVAGLELFRQKENVSKWKGFLLRFAPILILAAPLGYSCFEIVKNAGLILKYRDIESRLFIKDDIERIKEKLKNRTQPVLLVDSEFQPLFLDFRDVSINMQFKGNPKRLTPPYFERVTDVITQADPRILISCDLKKHSPKDLTDVQAYKTYCEWMRSNDFKKFYYPRSKTYHFHK